MKVKSNYLKELFEIEKDDLLHTYTHESIIDIFDRQWDVKNKKKIGFDYKIELPVILDNHCFAICEMKDNNGKKIMEAVEKRGPNVDVKQSVNEAFDKTFLRYLDLTEDISLGKAPATIVEESTEPKETPKSATISTNEVKEHISTSFMSNRNDFKTTEEDIVDPIEDNSISYDTLKNTVIEFGTHKGKTFERVAKTKTGVDWLHNMVKYLDSTSSETMKRQVPQIIEFLKTIHK